MNLFKLLCVLCASLLLVSCASLSKQASNHFEKGEYAAAASLYERALINDPGDAEAIEGLKRSRQQLIQERLIQVRLLRLANNSQDALDTLNNIMKDEASWKLSPTGVAFSTQTEECRESFKWFQSQIMTTLTAEQNLKAKIFSDKYSPIFAAGDLSTKFNRIEKAINDHGLAQCRTMRKSSTGAFAADFADRFCMVWGAKNRTTQSTAPTGLKTYGQIRLVGAITNLPEEVSSDLADALLAGLKTSPYYQPGAKPLEVKLIGSFTKSYDEHSFTALYSYNVDVPYQEKVSVPYEETVTQPYTDNESITKSETTWDPITHKLITKNSTTQQAVTRYREVKETRYRDEWQTKYRSEERTLQYPAMRFNLHYQVNANAFFKLDSVQYELPLNDELNLTDTYHEMENREIGLLTKQKNFPSSMDWLKDHFVKTQKEVSEKVEAAWDAKYCKFTPEQVTRTQTDAVMKCLRGTRRQHEFVDNWFHARFGLSFAAVNDVVGIVR